MRREGGRAADAAGGRGLWPSAASKRVTLGKSLPLEPPSVSFHRSKKGGG